MGEILGGLFNKKEKEVKVPTDQLQGEEFRARIAEDISHAEWAPQFSSALSNITLAELNGRSKIADNLILYTLLAQTASNVAAKVGNDEHLYSSSADVGMVACLSIATEANRRVHDYVARTQTPKP